MALVFHVFLVGLKIDISSIGRISKKAISFTVTGLIVPLALGVGFFYLLHANGNEGEPDGREITYKGSFFWAASLAVTSFPVVGRILADLKLLNSDIARLAMPIALISDMGSWILMLIVIPFCANPINAPYVITATTAYLLASFYTFRPFLQWLVHRTSEGNEDNYSDSYLCSFVVVGVVLNALFADVTGTHSIIGAFIFGLITPDKLARVLVQRFEFFVSGLLMPVFFAISGSRVDISCISEWSLVVVIVIMLCAVKIISFLPICFVSNIDIKDGFSLGLLMSTKGVWAILIIHTGLEKGVLHDQDYAVMMVTILLMTSIVAPTIAAIYKRTNLSAEYNSRIIQEAKTEAELRILACVNSFYNVPGILKLLDVSHAAQHNHTTVFTLQLVELTDRASAMLIVHDSHSRRFDDSGYHPHYGDSSETNEIVNAFREFGRKIRNISIQSLTAVSPLVAMHENICRLAEDKQVAFLILLFHKRAKTGGSPQKRSAAFRDINQNVLLHAPCSVGILIVRAEFNNAIHQIAMVFLGGADDREALAYAWRMSKHPGVSLMVIRLLEMDSIDLGNSKASMQSSSSYLDRQRQIDDDYINEFRLRTVGEELIVYEEKLLHNGEELVLSLKEIETKFELFIVGRRSGLESPLTTGLLNWVDCPELGVIGDLLAISDSATGSVLVVQQFVDSGNSQFIEELVGTPSSSTAGSVRAFGNRLSEAKSSRLGMNARQKRMDDDDDDDDDDDTY
ncbi:hypothetical protein REPUB_Repub13aG0217900 [Reevesia pubescens]